MADREKVIKGLIDLSNNIADGYIRATNRASNTVADALELLKEQPEIVRCKDCMHRPTDPENKGVGQSLEFPDDVCPCQIGDNWYSWMPKDDWFCADGERVGRKSETD